MSNYSVTKRPWLFFMLAYAYAWLLWLPSVLRGLGWEIPIDAYKYTAVVVPIGAFAPLLAAVTLIFREKRWQGVKVFLRQAFDFRVPPVYLVLALGLPLLIHALAHYLALGLGFEVAETLFPTENAPAPWVIAIPYFLLMLIIGGGQEEFGWRGYAQDPLQKKMGPIPASLLIGAVWGIWHLPLWFMPGDGHERYSFLAFLIMIISISVVYTWLFNASGRKLIVVVFFHAMSNTAAPLLPFLHWEEGKPETAYWVYAAVNVGFAAIFGYWLSKRKFPASIESGPNE